MGDIVSRREEQKARTRARIRTAAQDLFAESSFDAVTLIEIAATAKVSVQTVFNHFASKEELFFDERAQWVEGAAAAVRGRAPGEKPTTALRRHLVGSVEGFARAWACPRHRRMVEILDATPTLLAYERLLHEESVGLLAAALADAAGSSCRPVVAQVTAAVWKAAVRSIVVELRAAPPSPGDEQAVAEWVALTDHVLADLDECASFPDATARRVA